MLTREPLILRRPSKNCGRNCVGALYRQGADRTRARYKSRIQSVFVSIAKWSHRAAEERRSTDGSQLERSEAQPTAQDERREEIEFRIERALNGLRLAKAMRFAIEQEVSDRNPLHFQRLDHEFGLVRRNDPVV
jgi:hypothetical protein